MLLNKPALGQVSFTPILRSISSPSIVMQVDRGSHACCTVQQRSYLTNLGPVLPLNDIVLFVFPQGCPELTI